MNKFEDDQVLETPLSLIGRRVKVTTDYLNLHNVIQHAVIDQINIHVHQHEEHKVHDLKTFKHNALMLSKYITPEEKA